SVRLSTPGGVEAGGATVGAGSGFASMWRVIDSSTAENCGCSVEIVWAGAPSPSLTPSASARSRSQKSSVASSPNSAGSSTGASSTSTTTSNRSRLKNPPTPPLRSRLASTIVAVSPKRLRTSSRTDSRLFPSHRCRDKGHHSHALVVELAADLQVVDHRQLRLDVADEPAQRRADRSGADQHRLAALLLGGGGPGRDLGQEPLGDLGVEGQEAPRLRRAHGLQQGMLQQRVEGQHRQLAVRGVT